MTKFVYAFTEGNKDMKDLLGGKGANLAEMNLIGVPVPPGFTITTEVCNEYFEKGKEAVVALLKDDVEKSIKGVEALMKSKFGDVENPLLVSFLKLSSVNLFTICIHLRNTYSINHLNS